MATIAPSQITHAGVIPTFASASSGGDKFAPGDNVFLSIANLSGAERTITVDSPAYCSQGSQHDVVVAIPAGEGRNFGPFPAQRFAGSDGLASMTYSSEASVVASVITL